MYETKYFIDNKSFGLLQCFAQGVKFDALSLDQALARAQAEEKLVFVDVTASWCGPCKLMFEEVLSRKDVGEYCNEQFICIQINVDNLEGKDLERDMK